MTSTFRPVTDDDAELLRTATLGNVNWPGPRFTAADVDADPTLTQYTRFDTGRGDFGFVAEEGTAAHGVVWCQFFTAEEPGFAFVDEAIPELSVWVEEEHRGRGLGRALVKAAQQEARRRGIEAITLSVEDGNDARMLYLSLGFHDVAGRQDDGVMTWHDKI